MHRHTFDHPEVYGYVDISQNNHQMKQTHWDNMQSAKQLVADLPRPINNVKIYGGRQHGGGLEEGMAKFWRNIIGGMSSARFHRPGPERGFYGAGLGPLAQIHLRSARIFVNTFNIFRAEPAIELLNDRQENEAYIAATPGEQYAIYFTDGGSVKLDLSHTEGTFSLRWLNIIESEWSKTSQVTGGDHVRLRAPVDGMWVALLLRQS